MPPRCLLLEGVYYRQYQVEQAAERLGWDVKASKASKGEWSGSNLTFWPEDYGQMMGYDVVALANVDPRAIGDEGLEMLREYVQHGGGLIVLGGPMAFPAEGYPRTPLAEMLPVKFPGFMALTPVSNGVVEATSALDLAQGLDASQKPMCYWSHDFQTAGGEVALKAGGRPLLVLSKYGKGRVAVFLGAPLGDAPVGQTAFWQWTGWSTYLARLMERAAGRK